MILRALIVDDEPVARRRLKKLLESEPDVTVTGECEDGLQAVGAIGRLRPDLVFLDVQMPGLDGFDVIGAIGSSRMPPTIFVTAYDQYALRAFDAHAADYLLKPFDRARLSQAIVRARALALGSDAVGQRLLSLVSAIRAERPLERIVVRSGGRIYFVRTEEIDWIEAAGHYLTLHLGREVHLIRDSIRHLEARLDPARFLRLHRSAIVNVDRIKELQKSFHGEYLVTLETGARVQAGRAYTERIERLLAR
jgi:two-component system LytT family response regulator